MHKISFSSVAKGFLVLAFLLTSPLSLHSQPSMEMSQDGVVKNFLLPQRNQNGEVTSKIIGESAQRISKDEMKITEFTAELFENKKLMTLVSTPLCTLNTTTNFFSSDSGVSIRRPTLIAQGKSLRWNLATNEGTLRDPHHVQLYLKEVATTPSTATPPSSELTHWREKNIALDPNVTKARSRSLILKTQSHLIYLKDEAHIEGKDFTIEANQIEIHLEKKNPKKIKNLVARGDVLIDQIDRVVKAGLLIYHREEDKVELFEKPQILEKQNKIFGRKIILDKKKNILDIQDHARIIFRSSEQEKTPVLLP